MTNISECKTYSEAQALKAANALAEFFCEEMAANNVSVARDLKNRIARIVGSFGDALILIARRYWNDGHFQEARNYYSDFLARYSAERPERIEEASRRAN